MPIKSLKIAVLACLVLMGSMVGMRDTMVKLYQVPNKSSDYISKRWYEAIQKTYQDTRNPSKNTISVNANLINDEKLLEELIKAHTKGVNIQLLISQSSLPFMKKKTAWYDFLEDPLFQFKISEGSQNHAKFLITNYFDKQDQEHYLYTVGSSNFTPQGAYQSNETVELVEDKDYNNYLNLLNTFNYLYKEGLVYKPGETTTAFKKRKKEQIENTITTPPHKSRKPLETTPDGRLLCSTLECAIWESIDQRFERYKINQNSPSGFVYISSMTWNSPDLTQRLCELRDDNFEVKIFIDDSTLLNKTSRQQLFQMVDCGVRVNVYFGTGFRLQHAKFVLIRKTTQEGEKSIVSSMTQNVSYQNQDRDIFIMDSNNPTLFKDYENQVKNYESQINMKLLTKEDFDTMVKTVYKNTGKRTPTKKELDEEKK